MVKQELLEAVLKKDGEEDLENLLFPLKVFQLKHHYIKFFNTAPVSSSRGRNTNQFLSPTSTQGFILTLFVSFHLLLIICFP